MESNIEEFIALTDNLEQKLLAAEEFQWEDIRYALSFITEEENKGLYGLVCYYAAFYMIQNGKYDECLYFLNESTRCIRGTTQECEICRCYNMLGFVAHNQNNLVLAMEHYGRALIYARQYGRRISYSLILGNMADTYCHVGSYDRAITCYKECIKEMKEAGWYTTNRENMYRKILASYGYCLIKAGQIENAVSVAEELKLLIEENTSNTMVLLKVYAFLAFLGYQEGEMAVSDQYTDMAVQTIMKVDSISVDFDTVLDFIQYLILVEKFDSLQQVLDYIEPQVAIEQNEGFLLQLILFRLQYCSDEMEQESFLANTQIFFGLKSKHEQAENSQALRIMKLRKRLRQIEEEQSRLQEKNVRLLYRMEHDELSGLFNKRSLNQYMEEVFEEALHKKLPLGVLFVDIDYFKQMNDTYGHQRGDSCIITIADAIMTCMPEDYAARYGGDEFVIITIGRSKEYLQERAQMLVDNIKSRKIPNVNSKDMNIVTITIGAVHAIPHKPNKMWDFLSAADEALYQQKNEQKGCVRFYNGQGDRL